MRIKNKGFWAFLFLTATYCFFCVSIFAQVTLISEDFSTGSGTTPPTGWSNNQTGGAASELWEFDNPGSRAIGIPTVGDVAIFDSDFFGNNGTAEDASLESPSFDASAYATVTLLFDHFFQGGYGGAYSVDVYNGSVWSTVLSGTTTTGNASAESIDITTEANGAINAQVRFRWTGNWSWYWAVDNVRVVGTLSGTDTDGDGVNDDSDLDDDNDGILDLIEGGICNLDYSITGDIDGDRDRGPTNNDLNRDFIFGDDYFFNLNFSFATPVIIETTIGDANHSRTGTVTVDGVSEAISTTGNVFQTVSHSPTSSTTYSVHIVGFDMTVTTIVVYDLSSNVLAAFDFGRLGSPVFAGYIALHSASGPSSMSYDCGLSEDTDGDGYINSLDLDSDNDGIWDAVEAGHGETITDGRITGSVGGNGLDDDVETGVESGVLDYTISDTDSDGIFDAHELDADDDGCNDTNEESISDLDSDGIAGSGVPVVDSTGLVNSIIYLSPTLNNWQDDTQLGTYCIDTDVDGIVNGIDIDDDNDGIRDIDECVIDDVATPIADGIADNNFPTGYWDAEVFEGAYGIVGSTFGSTSSNFTGNGSSGSPIFHGEAFYGDNNTSLNFAQTWTATQNPTDPAIPNYIGGTYVGGSHYSIHFNRTMDLDGTLDFGGPGSFLSGDDVVEVIINGTQVYFGANCCGAPIQPQITVSSVAYSAGDEVQIKFVNIGGTGALSAVFEANYNCVEDFDGDGLINSLDLDSDNDGIWDAIEAGHGETITGGRITGTVGANGFDNALETSAESGLPNYTVTDSDSDDNADAYEIDSDDDGCNDTSEELISDTDQDGAAGTGPTVVDDDGLVVGVTYTFPPHTNWQNAAIYIGCTCPQVIMNRHITFKTKHN